MTANSEAILEELRAQLRENDSQITVGFLNTGNSYFLIEPAIEKLLEDDKEQFFDGLMSNYKYGQERYEKALRGASSDEEHFSEEDKECLEQDRKTFLSLFENSHKTGLSSARDYLCHRVIRKFFDEMSISVTYLGDDRQYSTIGTYTKFARKQEADEAERRAKIERTIEYEKGYKQRANEESDEKNATYNRKNRSLFRRIIEKFLGKNEGKKIRQTISG